MPNCRQSVRSNPLHIQPFLLDTASTRQRRGSWISFKTIPHSFINYTSNTVKVRDIYGSFKTIWFLSRPLHFCVFWCINSTFLVPFPCIQAKQVQTCQNSKFQIPLCQLCLLCTHVSKFDRVLKTHSNHNNSNNTIGRQFKFTSEMTLIGPHIVSKFQPNPTIIGKVIHHFVHSSFFQDHPQWAPPCVIASKSTRISFKTILVLSRPFFI